MPSIYEANHMSLLLSSCVYETLSSKVLSSS